MRKYDKAYPKAGGTWQGIINRRRWAEIERRGLTDEIAPRFSVTDRFNSLASAAFYRRSRLWIFRKELRMGRFVMGYEREEYISLFYLHLDAARGCDKPKLP